MERVSYSQYGMYSTCQHQYKLNYIDRLGESSQISTQFSVVQPRNNPTLFGCNVQCNQETSNEFES